jgi:hypothetical protein
LPKGRAVPKSTEPGKAMPVRVASMLTKFIERVEATDLLRESPAPYNTDDCDYEDDRGGNHARADE